MGSRPPEALERFKSNEILLVEDEPVRLLYTKWSNEGGCLMWVAEVLSNGFICQWTDYYLHGMKRLNAMEALAWVSRG